MPNQKSCDKNKREKRKQRKKTKRKSVYKTNINRHSDDYKKGRASNKHTLATLLCVVWLCMPLPDLFGIVFQNRFLLFLLLLHWLFGWLLQLQCVLLNLFVGCVFFLNLLFGVVFFSCALHGQHNAYTRLQVGWLVGWLVGSVGCSDKQRTNEPTHSEIDFDHDVETESNARI